MMLYESVGIVYVRKARSVMATFSVAGPSGVMDGTASESVLLGVVVG